MTEREMERPVEGGTEGAALRAETPAASLFECAADEYEALARQLHESVAEGQTMAETARVLRLLAPPDYALAGHKCEPVARMVMDEGRDWWLGRLLEPLADWPRETHCLHIQTPIKTVVLGVVQADLDQLNVLGYVMSGSHLNSHWVEAMAETMRKRAEGSESADSATTAPDR